MFDTRKFLKTYWPNEIHLINWISAYGETPPKRPAAAKWFSRSSIPTDWFALILILLEIQEGAPISLTRYKA